MKHYEKPAMKFMNLRNENTVAATCWGYHGTTTKLYCDLEGVGYCSFQIEEGSCALNLINVMYMTDATKDNPVPATAEQQSALYDTLLASGGDQGQPYKDMGITVVPDDPKPEWS